MTAMVRSVVLCLAFAMMAAPAVNEEAEAEATIRAQIQSGEWIDAGLVDPWGGPTRWTVLFVSR